MRYRILALLLTLTVISWSQTATQSTAPNRQQKSAAPEKATCPCCDKMAAGKMKCAHQMQAMDGNGSDAMSSNKEGMTCMRNKQSATASCCGKDCAKDKCDKARNNKGKTGSCCGDHGKNCCAGKTGEKTANICCQHEPRG